MRRFFGIIFAAFMILAIPTEELVAGDFDVLARINNEVITRYDLKNSEKLMAFNLKSQVKNFSPEELRAQSLNFLIESHTYSEAARIDGIAFSQEEFDAFFQRLLEANGMDEKTMRRQITSAGIDWNFYLDRLRATYLWNKLIEQRIAPNVVVSNADIREAGEYIMDNSKRVRFNVSEITIFQNNTPAETRKLAEEIYGNLKNGGNFEDAAKKFSQSSTASSGGVLGWIDQKDINQDIFNVIKNLRVGEVSSPIYLGDDRSGVYMILKLNDRRTESITKNNESDRLRALLFNQKLTNKIHEYLDNVRKNIFVEVY